MSARSNLGADLLQMFVHAFGVGRGHDDGRTDRATGADRAVEICGVVTVVPDHGRSGADWRPDIGMSALLPDTGLILKPDLDRAVGDAGEKVILQQAGEALLKILLCFRILPGMKRARLQSGKLQLAQPLADRSLVYRHGEPLGHLVPQVEASPTHHLVGLGIGASDSSSSICASSRAGSRPELQRDLRPVIPAAL